MNEDEIMRMASAIIDAFTISGTKIYTTRYIESTLQEDAVPNYVVKPEVLDLINSDPNITEIATKTLNLQARIDLEQRLSGLTDDHLNAVVAGHQIEDTCCQQVDDGHRQAYHDGYQRHHITVGGTLLLILVRSNVLDTLRRFVYIYF